MGPARGNSKTTSNNGDPAVNAHNRGTDQLGTSSAAHRKHQSPNNPIIKDEVIDHCHPHVHVSRTAGIAIRADSETADFGGAAEYLDSATSKRIPGLKITEITANGPKREYVVTATAKGIGSSSGSLDAPMAVAAAATLPVEMVITFSPQTQGSGDPGDN